MSTSRAFIGSMIKHQREKKGMTLQQLADLLEVDRQYVLRLENGRINVTPDYLDIIIEKIGCSQEDCFKTPKS